MKLEAITNFENIQKTFFILFNLFPHSLHLPQLSAYWSRKQKSFNPSHRPRSPSLPSSARQAHRSRQSRIPRDALLTGHYDDKVAGEGEDEEEGGDV